MSLKSKQKRKEKRLAERLKLEQRKQNLIALDLEMAKLDAAIKRRPFNV